MAIIYSYPIVVATLTDLVLGSDISGAGNPTKNFTVQSLIDLVPNNLGDLQSVLDIGNTATGGNASITLGTLAAPQGFVSTASFTDGTLVITGGNLATAGVVTALNLSGTLLTNAQPNVTSLGTLTSLAVNTSVTGTAVVTTLSAPGDNLKIASTKAIVDYIATKPSKETLAETLVAGSVTGGTDIQVSAGDDVTFTDTSKAIFGASSDLEIFHNPGGSNTLQSNNLKSLDLLQASIQVLNQSGSELMIGAIADGAVSLYYNGVKKFETSNTGVKITGVSSTSAGSVGAPAYTFTGDLNTGMFHPAAEELGFSTNGVLRLKVKNAGVDITGVTTTTSFTTTASTGGVITRITTEGEGIAANDVDTMIPTNAAVKDYVDTQSDAKTLNYKDATATTYQMNLFGDTLQLAGGTNITSAALGVAANKAVVTFNLDNSIVLSGQVKADNFTTTAGTATWATTVLAGFTSITSDLFTGPLTGNATTATALAATGAITLLGDTTSTGGPYTYTAGGALNISTTIADTTVTGKVLTGYSVVTSGAIDANDSILEAFEKIQATITGLPEGGINYIGTWDASGGGAGVPDLTVAATHVPGHYYVVGADSPAAGTFPNGGAVPPSEWKIGDWVIRADSTLNLWQKLDNTSSIEGSGAVNKVARWTSSQILGTGLITDDLSTVTIGNTGAFVVEGNATFGNTDTDTVTVKGPATFEEITRLNLGLSANGSEGTATQVLTSGGAATAMTWTTPTIGTVTSVGLTETGDALTITNSPITTSGDINIAGAGNNTQYINGALDFVAFPPVDNYNYWALVGDTGAAQLISSTDTATFAGGFGISTVVSATDTLTTAIDIIGTDNAIAGLTAATPLATDTLWFNDISDSNTIRKATISDIVDLGNETLAQVLVNGNTAGAKNIVFPDSTAATNGRVTFGASTDLEIYHDSNHGYVKTANGGDLKLEAADDIVIKSGTDGAANGNIYLSPNNGQNGIEIISGGAVKLFYDSQGPKLETTNTGVSVTDNLYVSYGSGGNLYLGPQTGSGGSNSEITTNHSLYIDYAKITGTSGNFNIRNNTTQQFTIQGSSGRTELNQYGSGTITGTPTYNLEINSLGHILETTPSAGGGGGTAKGGTFSKLFTSVSGGSIAFLINRDTTGTMVFDVMMTSDTSTTCSIAKKFTIVKQFGVAPVVYKILDTGPDGSNDFTPVFAQHTNNTNLKCTITPNNLNTQKIGITIDLGFGQNNAEVVMNA